MQLQIQRRTFLAGLGAAGAAACASGPADPALAAMPPVKGLPAARASSAGLSDNLTSSIAQMMQGHIDGQRITGGVTAVARRNKLVHFSGHGVFDRDAGSPMRTDGLFRMMSSTKPVTAVALLQQQEEGKLALEDKVSRFIPELKEMRVWTAEALAARRAGGVAAMRAPVRPEETVPANRELTLFDLATHTSGLNGSATRGAGDTLASYIPRLKDTPLDFQPGDRWAYSAATGPDVLARIVEITSGVPYDRYLRERIFEPLGMRDTAHNLSDEQRTRLLPRYARTRDGSAWELADGQDVPRPTTYFAGAYGLSSTAHDYLMFESMLLNKGAFNGKRVLKPESVALMSSNLIGDKYRGIAGTTRGTGFGVQVRVVLDAANCGCGRSNGAFGWGGAYGTMTWADPGEELVGVLMLQQSVQDVQNDFEQVIRAAIMA